MKNAESHITVQLVSAQWQIAVDGGGRYQMQADDLPNGILITLTPDDGEAFESHVGEYFQQAIASIRERESRR